MKKNENLKKINYGQYRTNNSFARENEKNKFSSEGLNIIPQQRKETEYYFNKNLTPEKNEVNNYIYTDNQANNYMTRKDLKTDVYASNFKIKNNSDSKNNKSRFNNSQNYNNINNVNNNNLNFHMNFLIDESQTPKLNFPVTTKFNNLLDKEGFKHIMDLKYAKNKMNQKPSKRDQSSTKIHTQSNNPNSIVSNKSEQNGIRYENAENLGKLTQKFNENSRNNYYNSSDLRNLGSSYDSKNISISLWNGKGTNINTSSKDTIDYLKEYEEKLREHLKKNLKEKLGDEDKVDEIIQEMQNFSRKEILKIPIKQKYDSSFTNSVVKSNNNLNSINSQVSSNSNNLRSIEKLDSCKNYYKDEFIPSNFNNFPNKNGSSVAYHITKSQTRDNLNSNYELRNMNHTSENYDKNNQYSNIYKTNSSITNFNKSELINSNAKETYELERERIINKNYSLIEDQQTQFNLNDKFQMNNKSSLLNLKKNLNVKSDPFTHSPKKANQKSIYENSLFSKFNNYKPKKEKDTNNYLANNSKNNFNSNSIQMSGLSNAFKTYINSNKPNITEARVLANSKIKQTLTKNSMNNNFSKLSPHLNKIKTVTKNLNNSAGKVKLTPNKLKAKTSIMDIVSDKLKRDFINMRNNVNIFKTKDDDVENNKRGINYSQDLLQDQVQFRNSTLNTNGYLATTENENILNNNYNNQNYSNKNSKVKLGSIDKNYLNSILNTNKVNSRNHKDIFILDEIESSKNGYLNETGSQAANRYNSNKSQSNKGENSSHFIEGKINNNIQNYEKNNLVNQVNENIKTDEFKFGIYPKDYEIDNFNCDIKNYNSNFVANNKLFKFIQESQNINLQNNKKLNEKYFDEINGEKSQKPNKIDSKPIKNKEIALKKTKYDLKYPSKLKKTISDYIYGRGGKIRSYSPKINRQTSSNKIISNTNNRYKEPNLDFLLLRKPSILDLKKKYTSVSNERKNETSSSHRKDFTNMKKSNILTGLKQISTDKFRKNIESSKLDSNRTDILNKSRKKITTSNRMNEEDNEKIKDKVQINKNSEIKKSWIENQKNNLDQENLDSEEYKIEKNFNDLKIKIENKTEAIEDINYNVFNNICPTDIKNDLVACDKKIESKMLTNEFFNNQSNYVGYKSNKANLLNNLMNSKNKNLSNYENQNKEKMMRKNNTNSIIKPNYSDMKTNLSKDKITKINNVDIIKKYNLKPTNLGKIVQKEKLMISDKNLKMKDGLKEKNIGAYKEFNNSKDVSKINFDPSIRNYLLSKAEKSKSINIIKKQDKLNLKENPNKIVDYINNKCQMTKNDSKNKNIENEQQLRKDDTPVNAKNGNLDYDLMNKIINSLDDEYKGLFNFSYDNYINKEKSENESLLSQFVDDL